MTSRRPFRSATVAAAPGPRRADSGLTPAGAPEPRPGASRVARAAAVAALSLALLSACAPTSPELSPTDAAAMQTSVVGIADVAAAGDYTTATSRLAALQAQLDAAIAAGTVTSARGDRIQTAIDAVTADVAALVAAATPTATTTPSPTVTPVTAAPVPTPTVPGPGNGDNTGPGAGNGNDTGPGAGNGSDKPGNGNGPGKGNDKPGKG
ncbi:hypothetical protein [Glaciihabitans sp. dw_435]|uniref:hypothetical protein n=1 Tax=Glaciihabitans sp. dw_435 TaxID=2720081 RepID=UPI001BD281C3|nr:hypothetical protein [Glaciihabitans sp. dw_435]